MSDFFSHLLDRHQGTTPVVEPRLRGRFEPPGPGRAAPPLPPAAPDQRPADDALRVGPASDFPPPAASVPRRPAPPIVPVAVPPLPRPEPATPGTAAPATAALGPGLLGQGPPETGLPPKADSESPTRNLPKRIAAAPPVAPTAPDSAPVQVVVRPMMRQAAPVAASGQASSMAMPAGPPRRGDTPPDKGRGPDDDSRRRRWPEAARPAQPIDAIPMAVAARPAEADAASRAASQRPASPDPTPAADAHRRDPLLIAPAWLAPLQAEIQRQGDPRRPQKQPEPVIHVTIGRVEVRAAAPPEPPKPAARNKPPAVMSLDDYLKQRQGRGGL